MKIRYEIEAEGDTATEVVTVDGAVVARVVSTRTDDGCVSDEDFDDLISDREIREALSDVSFLPLNFLQAVYEGD